MNKKEVLEIRKQFTPENCAITRICGCYVDHEKTKRMQMKEAFLSMPEEEEFKYFDLLRKTLSGKIGRNLLNLEIPLEEAMPGGAQEFLLRLRDSKLQDDMLLEKFYDKVIENYICAGNYYIVLIHAMYDIPGRASDQTELYDASEEVYEHLLCSICPVELSKAGLCYDEEENQITERRREWEVGAPVKGFLFPAFNDRNTDIHSALYYTKKTEELQEQLTQALFGVNIPLSAEAQKSMFQKILGNVLENRAGYSIVMDVYDRLYELLEDWKDDPDPVTVGKYELRRILENSGAAEEMAERFEKEYEEFIGRDTLLQVSNLVSPKGITIKTADATIRLEPSRMDMLETTDLHGMKCLAVNADGLVEMNGISVVVDLDKQEV